MGREQILNAIKKNKPELVILPEINLNLFSAEIDILDTFQTNVKLVGGQVVQLKSDENLAQVIKELYPKANHIVSQVEGINLGTFSLAENTDPHTLENIDLAIIKGEFGVAENGAIWISDRQFLIRVLPFITNDLVIVLSKQDLCDLMHNAYKKIADRKRTFGLFISGPSKTADIEQCLVIGAQGAMSLTVFLVS